MAKKIEVWRQKEQLCQLSKKENTYFENFLELAKLRHQIYNSLNWWPKKMFLPERMISEEEQDKNPSVDTSAGETSSSRTDSDQTKSAQITSRSPATSLNDGQAEPGTSASRRRATPSSRSDAARPAHWWKERPVKQEKTVRKKNRKPEPLNDKENSWNPPDHPPDDDGSSN